MTRSNTPYYVLRNLRIIFREYAQRGGQVFVSTHSPEFVNAIRVNELFWLTKRNGNTTVTKASEDEIVKSLFENGDKLGWLWQQGYFKGSSPKDF